MVEVFKTNVKTKRQANAVISHIHQQIKNCSANFDLEDCDKILRITYSDDRFNFEYLIELLTDIGIVASILPDGSSSSELGINLSLYLDV